MRVLLLGHPVEHSLSPPMQNAAFASLGLDHNYEAIDVAEEKLAAYLSLLRTGGFLGANVTVPYKLAVVAAMDELDGDAERLGAVNTIVVREGRLLGHNTDVVGALEGLLVPVRLSLRGGSVLVLGAGGATRAILAALAALDTDPPSDIVVLARRSEAAEDAAALGVALGLSCRAAAWWNLEDELRRAGVVINCTPMGLHDDDPLASFPVAGRVVLDLTYAPGGTPLFRRAWAEGAVALQGEEMLLHQGAAAFTLWTGRPAPVAVMREVLKTELARTWAGH